MTNPTKAVAAVIATCAVLLAAAPVAAVDGEILIDQAKVNAGGITPGDAPGFPATLSRRGRYKLAGNLNVTAGQNGIDVTQHDVTIDLTGFTISTNSPSQPAFGISARNITGLRVMNGTITGFQSSAILNDGLGSFFTVVENMRVVGNVSGIVIGNDSRLLNSTVANTANGGVICFSRCAIEQNLITGNDGYGIVMGGGSVALGNVIVSNSLQGLYVNNPSGGYGNNMLFGNNDGDTQVFGNAVQLHPNVCQPACP